MFNLENFRDSIVLKEGQSTAIEIPFSASPQPKVKWQFNGDPIPISDRLAVDTIRGMTSLCIGRAEPQNAGKYSVTLENLYGKVTLAVNVTVLGEPTNSTCCNRDISQK